MESELKKLILKLDKLMEIQELILEKLNQKNFITNEPNFNFKTQTKKEEKDNMMEEMMLVILNGHRIKHDFNLYQKPDNNKILAYLRTNDPRIFDGLKRKSN